MKTIIRLFGIAQMLFLLALPTLAQSNITTERYDNARTGADLNEYQLNTSNVNATQFGKLFSYVVDGSIYAQPLYVPGVTIPGQGVHNVLYAATMNDVIYAFDADSNTVGNAGALWVRDFRSPLNVTPVVTPIPITDIVGSNTLNIVGNVGIESTPVIDLTTNTIYLVVRTKEVSGTTTSYVARLHALDITTGAEKFGGPTVIQGSVPGNGNGSSGGVLTLDTFIQNQRSSLALVNGYVVFSFASHEDLFAWHGWALAYNATTLQQTSILSFTPNGAGGGSWMAGRAPAVDSAGNLYYMTGNGDWDGVTNFGDSIVKLSLTNGVFAVADYFTPDDYAALQANDEDLGSGGPMLVPGTDLIIGGGKESILYLTHTGTQGMGHEQTGNGQIVQLLRSGTTGFFTGGSPSYWNRTTGAGPTMYIWPDCGGGTAGKLASYHFNGTTFDTTPLSKSSVTCASGYSTGAAVTISANGSTPGTGIVWASLPTASAGHGTSPGLLRAFDANNVTTELWDSTINDSRDDSGTWSKFVPPTVANGKVYLGSFSGALNVYGLLSTSPDFTISANPGSNTISAGASANYTVNIAALNGYNSAVSLNVTGLPTGATYSFSVPSPLPGQSTTLTVNTSSTTPSGAYTLTVTAISGSLTHIVTVNLVVGNGPDFTIAANPGSQTVLVGNPARYTATVAALGGFTGVVTLTASGQPAGTTVSFSPPTLTGSGTSTLTVTTTGSTPVGTYPLTITGTSGTLTHTTTVSLVVNAQPPPPDFTITANPSTQTVIVGNTTTYTATIGALNGFGGVVTLTATGLPTGATPSFSPATVTGAGASTLTVTTSSSTPAGTTTITITGTSGSVVHTTTVSLTVVAAGTGVVSIDFVGQGTVMGSTEVAGVVAKANWNNASGLTNTTGQALADETGTPTGATVVWNTNGIWSLPITDTPGNARMMRGYLDTTGATTTVTVAGLPANAAGYDVYVYADGNNNAATRTGAYQISGPGITTTSVNLTDAANTDFSGTYTQANNSNGNYVKFTVTATGFTITATPGASTDAYPRAPVNGIQIVRHVATSPDFSITASPSSQTVLVGNPARYTATVAALGGFTGVVTLTASGQPAGTTVSFSPPTLTGSGTSTLTVTTTGSTPVGTYPLTITGTSGTLTHTTTVSLVVNAQPPPPDFTITANPSTQTVIVGNTTTYTATIGALNGFGGVVTLTATGLPTGATPSFSPATVTGAGASTLTVTTSSSTPAGTTTITITGTSGSVVHTTTVSLTVVAAGTGVVSIDFVGQGTVMGSTEVAGVVAKANWNNASGLTNTTGQALVDETGSATGAKVTWNTNGSWNLPITDTPGNARMMRGYLDTTGATTTVTVAGLPANAAGYDVYVYADGNNNAATRTGAYQISGPGITTTSVNLTDAANTDFSGTYTQANNSNGNYVKFTVTATGFTITATPGASTDAYPRAPVNGIQIVPHVVTSPDFSITVTPSSQTVVVGNVANYTTNITALAGFTGVVTLTASGQPAGTTVGFSPTTLTGSGTSTLTVTTTGSTPVGTYPLTITGTSGTLTHTTTVSLVVNAQPPPPDFTITANPSTQTVIVGNTTTYTATIGALNGFGGVVTLTATGLPTGATPSFSPATVTGAGASTLTVTTSSSTPAGTTTITITGTSGSVVHTTTVSLTVVAAGTGVVSIDFVGQGTVMGSTEVAGVVAKANWNNASGLTNTTGQALVDETGSATGAKVTWNTNGIWNLSITDTPGDARMMRGYLDTVGATTTVTVSGLPAHSAGYAIYIYADGSNNAATRTAAYQISGVGITATSVNLTDAANTDFSGTYTQANNSNGNYVKFTVTAAGFTITATPGASTDAYPRAPLNGMQIVPQ